MRPVAREEAPFVVELSGEEPAAQSSASDEGDPQAEPEMTEDEEDNECDELPHDELADDPASSLENANKTHLQQVRRRVCFVETSLDDLSWSSGSSSDESKRDGERNEANLAGSSKTEEFKQQQQQQPALATQSVRPKKTNKRVNWNLEQVNYRPIATGNNYEDYASTEEPSRIAASHNGSSLLPQLAAPEEPVPEVPERRSSQQRRPPPPPPPRDDRLRQRPSEGRCPDEPNIGMDSTRTSDRMSAKTIMLDEMEPTLKRAASQATKLDTDANKTSSTLECQPTAMTPLAHESGATPELARQADRSFCVSLRQTASSLFDDERPQSHVKQTLIPLPQTGSTFRASGGPQPQNSPAGPMSDVRPTSREQYWTLPGGRTRVPDKLEWQELQRQDQKQQQQQRRQNHLFSKQTTADQSTCEPNSTRPQATRLRPQMGAQRATSASLGREERFPRHLYSQMHPKSTAEKSLLQTFHSSREQKDDETHHIKIKLKSPKNDHRFCPSYYTEEDFQSRGNPRRSSPIPLGSRPGNISDYLPGQSSLSRRAELGTWTSGETRSHEQEAILWSDQTDDTKDSSQLEGHQKRCVFNRLLNQQPEQGTSRPENDEIESSDQLDSRSQYLAVQRGRDIPLKGLRKPMAPSTGHRGTQIDQQQAQEEANCRLDEMEQLYRDFESVFQSLTGVQTNRPPSPRGLRVVSPQARSLSATSELTRADSRNTNQSYLTGPALVEEMTLSDLEEEISSSLMASGGSRARTYQNLPTARVSVEPAGPVISGVFDSQLIKRV